VVVDKGVNLLGKYVFEKRFYRIARFGVMDKYDMITYG
jgi:hypothetical protein